MLAPGREVLDEEVDGVVHDDARVMATTTDSDRPTWPFIIPRGRMR